MTGVRQMLDKNCQGAKNQNRQVDKEMEGRLIPIYLFPCLPVYHPLFRRLIPPELILG